MQDATDKVKMNPVAAPDESDCRSPGGIGNGNRDPGREA